MNEEVAAQSYLVDYLTADTTLMSLVNDVWIRTRPANAALPAIKIDRQDSNDLYVVNLSRVWADLTFLVRGIIQSRSSDPRDEWTEAQAIGDRIDALLHDHEDSTPVLQIHSFREEPFTDETIEDGLFLHCGGIYRLRAHAV